MGAVKNHFHDEIEAARLRAIPERDKDEMDRLDAWEAIARNMAMVIQDAVEHLHRYGRRGGSDRNDDIHKYADEIAGSFERQCKAHGVTP